MARASTSVWLILAACSSSSDNPDYFGKIAPPKTEIMRYISGSEPESLDPHLSTGQPEARIQLSLFEGLVEYHPVNALPIPAIAERWDINGDSSEFTFHLRKTAKWSNGRPILAHDFVWSMQRAISPELAARNAYLAYDVLYAQAFNEGGVFARDRSSGQFLLSRDFNSGIDDSAQSLTNRPLRLTLPGPEPDREKAFAANPKLSALKANLEFVPVQAGDVGVAAVDDHTFRISFAQPSPYFLKLLAHQFFRPVPREAAEKHGHAWTKPGHIITSGPFHLAEWLPYNEIIVKRSPTYWDASRVKLTEIHFYALDEITTMQNLYKAGAVDAIYNHTVPAAWLDFIRGKKDYMDQPEASIEYYTFNVKRAPMNDVRVRKAFNLAIDKVALAKFRKTYKPLTAFTPEGIFPGYPQPKGDVFDPKRARQLLAEAGFGDGAGNFEIGKFPTSEVELMYNTAESNRQVAEFIQAQWKQNLGLTVPLRNMEFKTFLGIRAALDYKGMARAGWGADYMDPYTFLALFTTPGGDNGTGWYEPKFVEMLKEANREPRPQDRYAKMAAAEAFLLQDQPVIPLGTPSTSWMKKPYVKGMYPNPVSMFAWKYVYIERDPSKWANNETIHVE